MVVEVAPRAVLASYIQCIGDEGGAWQGLLFGTPGPTHKRMATPLSGALDVVQEALWGGAKSDPKICRLQRPYDLPAGGFTMVNGPRLPPNVVAGAALGRGLLCRKWAISG
jgi:hypothetical protein